MSNSNDLPVSWYADPMWMGHGTPLKSGMEFGLVSGCIKGVRALFTPPGALHIGSEKPPSWKTLEQLGIPCIILDLPPGMPFEGGSSWDTQKRHTRQLKWSADVEDPVMNLPSHRLKQIRKGERHGLRIELIQETDRILDLHQAARQRKQLNSDESILRPQLEEILKSPHQTACVILDEQGHDLASAVFLHEKGRTIYAFGGQKRSKESAWASVMLIAEGIRSAHLRGNTCFDFGGSMDPGVDQFYAEFGAQPVTKLRCTRIVWWVRPWMRWTRPDLFVK